MLAFNYKQRGMKVGQMQFRCHLSAQGKLWHHNIQGSHIVLYCIKSLWNRWAKSTAQQCHGVLYFMIIKLPQSSLHADSIKERRHNNTFVVHGCETVEYCKLSSMLQLNNEESCLLKSLSGIDERTCGKHGGERI